jgi:carboxyl-terminal processing protease
MRSTRSLLYLPFFLGISLAFGIFIGHSLQPGAAGSERSKLKTVLDYIEQEYVDPISADSLVETTIEAMLSQLDPHSAYIPAKDLQKVNESLEGNFEGIGIEFHIQQDTIMVVSAIPGGPSEKVGLMAGDRIVKVDGKSVAGVGITNELVQKNLRGKGGSEVTVSIFRRNKNNLIDFKIIRGKIPLNSLETAYMIDSKTGFIKISRFSATTYEECKEALEQLKREGLQSLILDLRGNPGGFLDAATKLADEFLDGNKLIVYTSGKSRPRSEYKAKRDGLFEKGKLIVLIDEGSASASEILSGAIQDWDRGTIIGRRSFGKGLVQEQSELPDGSALRLTIARYYTPSGRSIQKPYDGGVHEYEGEVYDRYKHGELLSPDSIKQADSLQYKTASGRKVYGGGGIMPDVFVPLDTSYNSNYLDLVYAGGLINRFAYDYVDTNRDELKAFSSPDDFRKNFPGNGPLLSAFVEFAEKNGISKDPKGIAKSGDFLRNQLRAYIARLQWQNDGLYPILHEQDKAVREALRIIRQTP